MTTRKALFTTLTCLAIFLTGAWAAADVIGINYVGTGGGSLLSSEAAGFLVVDDNWNNINGVGQGPPATPVNNLVDGDNDVTTLDVVSWTQSSNNSWSVGHDGSPQSKLNADFNDQQPTITLAEIPYASYSVAVHYNNNEGPSTSFLTLTGSVDDLVSRNIQTGNTAASSYDANGYLEETGLLTGSTNVTVFTGLNDSGLVIALTGSNNNGITAIQIVENVPPVPEPGTFVLLAFGALGLAGSARRRRRIRA